MIEIFNVLIKGFEVNDINYCEAFRTEEQVNKFVEEVCSERNWTIKSRLGWSDDNTIDDRRVEDSKGNTYYFVIYRQFV